VKNAKVRSTTKLYSFDATTVDLCLGLYDWAKFRKTKGGIKIHVKLNHAGYIPEFVTVTEAKRHESKELPKLKLKSGDVVVFDRAFTDFRQFASYCDEGIYFVTRLKKNAHYRVFKRHDVGKHKNISSDQIIEMKGFYTRKKCPVHLRRIRVKDPETGKYIVLLTNQLAWSPVTVAAVYKDRWKIEIFFKTLKQNLKIKSFIGTSENAVLIQIWSALITILLLSVLKTKALYKWHMSNLVGFIRLNLFVKIDLFDLLNYPFFQANAPPGQIQIRPRPGSISSFQ